MTEKESLLIAQHIIDTGLGIQAIAEQGLFALFEMQKYIEEREYEFSILRGRIANGEK